MYFLSCHKRETEKKFWVPIRNWTSDLQMLYHRATETPQWARWNFSFYNRNELWLMPTNHSTIFQYISPLTDIPSLILLSKFWGKSTYGASSNHTSMTKINELDKTTFHFHASPATQDMHMCMCLPEWHCYKIQVMSERKPAQGKLPTDLSPKSTSPLKVCRVMLANQNTRHWVLLPTPKMLKRET